jgi:hypothetical protein
LILNRTKAALAVWASAWHHAAHGGTGHPPYNEITNEPTPCDESGEAIDSSLYYSATRSKYRERPPNEIDLDVLADIEAVERALKRWEGPAWLRQYLLFRYPETGRFEPPRYVTKFTDPSDPQMAFVESGYLNGRMRKRRTKDFKVLQLRMVCRAERRFLKVLSRELKNLPDGVQERAVRSGSRARRGRA